MRTIKMYVKKYMYIDLGHKYVHFQARRNIYCSLFLTKRVLGGACRKIILTESVFLIPVHHSLLWGQMGVTPAI